MKLELFSCAGGMALGFRRAGIEFDFVIDKDSDAVSSYETNLGQRPLQMDARDFLRLTQGGAHLDVELLVADPPCTPWSRAGKRKGTADDRDMLLVTCELITLLRPKAFLVGNVPGLDDSNNWPTVQKTLGAIPGYCVDYRALDAADYGIPQHRIRPFWFGHQTGPCLRWPRPTHGDPNELGHAVLGDDRLPWRTCRDALEHLPLAELGTPARMRMRACNGKQLGSIGDRPARVVGTSNLSDGNVLTHPDGPVTRKKRAFHNGHPTSAPDEPAHTLTCEGGRSQSYGHAGVLVPPDEHVVVRAGHHITSPRHPALEADAPCTTIRGGGEGHSHPRLVLGAQELLGNEKHRPNRADTPSHAITTKGDGRGAQGAAVLLTDDRVLLGDDKHPPNTPDEPSKTIMATKGAGGAQGAAVLAVDGKGRHHVPQSCDDPSATITTPLPGPRSRKALQWPWATPSTTVATRAEIEAPGHHGAKRGPRNANCIVLSEKAAAILQGFPDTWTFCGQTKRARWSQIGQAMPPGLAEAVARRIVVWFDELAALNPAPAARVQE